MSEEQQAVLDEGQVEVVENQESIDTPTTETELSSVESAPTENAETDGVQKRINKLTAEKYGEKRQREALEEENKRLKSLIPQTETVEQPKGRPTLDQFDFDEGQHQAALIAYEVDQRLAATNEARQKEKATRRQQEIDASYDANEVKYATDNPDYINDVQNLPRFNNETLSLIKAQENAPNLVHYLGKNLDLANTIASLDPMSAAVQVGVISAKLSARKTTQVQPSTAPEPIPSLTTGAAALSGDEEDGITYE